MRSWAVTTRSWSQARPTHLGYLPEQPPLYDEMTVREYLRFVAALKGVAARAIPAHVDEVMELTGLTSMQSRLLGHLSKGFRQRAGMAQALCGDPDVLVLDEPTVGLDPRQITEIRALIHTLGKSHTILFSSHILSEVQQLCDHVVILDHGQVKLDAALAQLSAPEDITVLLTVDAPEAAILSRLKQLEGVRRATVQPAAQSGCTSVLLQFHRESEPERRLFALLSGLNIPILHLSRVGVQPGTGVLERDFAIGKEPFRVHHLQARLSGLFPHAGGLCVHGGVSHALRPDFLPL